jgi:hypothetical protein
VKPTIATFERSPRSSSSPNGRGAGGVSATLASALIFFVDGGVTDTGICLVLLPFLRFDTRRAPSF